MNVRNARLALVVLALLIPCSAFAQITKVTPIDPGAGSSYDGRCYINSVTAIGQPSGNYGTMNFTCTGSFPGQVTASLYLESTVSYTTDPTSRVTVNTTYDSRQFSWPRWVPNCFGGYCGPSSYEDIPRSYSMSVNAPAWIGYQWQVRGVVAYNVETCNLYGCSVTTRRAQLTKQPVWTY